MLTRIFTVALLSAFALTATPIVYHTDAVAQKKSKKAKKVKAGKNQKVCRYRFPDGERRTWVCHKDVPCCAWDAIKYVKCGNTITKCL